MNIYLHSLSNYATSFVQENFFSSLTNQQKKTAVIAAAIFGSLFICYLVINHCYFKATLSEKPDNLDSIDDHLSQKPTDEASQKEMQDQAVLKKLKDQTLHEKDLFITKDFQKIDKDCQSDTQQSSRSPSASLKENKLGEDDESAIDFSDDESIDDEPIDEEIIISPAPYYVLLLPNFGQVRRGTDEGDTPDFMGMCSGTITVIDSEKLWAAAFSSWIHTTESQTEILHLIKSICAKIDFFPNSEKQYLESFARLYNHTVKLHDALPGESKKKEIKIYWNQNTEDVLFPYLLKNEKIDMNDLLFAFVPGESIETPFQAPVMDFTNQLQFVGLNKDKIMKDLQCELKRLSETVLGQDILPQLEEEIESVIAWNNPLMKDAQIFTLQNNLRIHLLAMEAKGEKINFNKMDVDTRSGIIQDFFHS